MTFCNWEPKISFVMDYLSLGSRIRKLREKKGLEISEFSKATGLSEEAISAIEANRSQPLIGELIRIAKALGVNVADILRDRPTKQSFDIIRSAERKKVKPLLEASDNKIFDYQYELLTLPSSEKHLDAYLIELPPHQSKPPRHDMTHEGEEFIYLLEGEIQGEIAGKAFKLAPGDSLYLRSTEPHVFYNPGSVIARALTVIYPF